MSLRAALTLATALTLVLALSSGLSASRAQEETPPAPPEESAPEALEPAEEVETVPDEPAKHWFGERLEVRTGVSAFHLRGRVSGTTHREETQVQPLRIEQINQLHFDGTTGAAWTLDLRFKLGRRWFVTADVITSSLPSEGFTDDRLIAKIGGTGDFTLARFEADHEADYLEWSIGGAFRAWPRKPTSDPTFYVDAILQFRKADNDYLFRVGEMTANPFEPPAFFLPRFDPYGMAWGTYEMGFERLLIGARLGWKIAERWTLEAMIAPTLMAKFDGTADLGGHGIAFEHKQGSAHTQPVFHVYNCDSDDNDPTTPDCAGLVDGDLLNPSLMVQQESDDGAGIDLGLNVDYFFSDLFGLSFGYKYQHYRSKGGSEERIFGDDVAAGCPLSPTAGPACTDEEGDLGKAAIVTHALYVFGKFTWE